MKPNVKRILVTGASGFIGGSLVEILSENNFCITASSRNKLLQFSPNVRCIKVAEADGLVDWSLCVVDQDIVVHCAGRAHVLNEGSGDPLPLFRRVNVESTIQLALQAAAAGVKRFIFLSSIGVNGDKSFGRPFTEEDSATPHSPYAQSKYEAEIGLWEVSKKTGMELVIIRPPLVYGPSAPGNFGRLLWLVKAGVPLPFARLRNKRSLVALGNLTNFIITCISHSHAANQLFLVSDDSDLSITEILIKLASVNNLRLRLFSFPWWLVNFVFVLCGQSKKVQSLLGDLQVSISKAKIVLDWSPPISVDEAFLETTKAIVYKY